MKVTKLLHTRMRVSDMDRTLKSVIGQSSIDLAMMLLAE